MTEVKVVSIKVTDHGWTGAAGEEKLQKFFNEGFSILRADVVHDTVVYIMIKVAP